jgi:hypothetical protein
VLVATFDFDVVVFLVVEVEDELDVEPDDVVGAAGVAGGVVGFVVVVVGTVGIGGKPGSAITLSAEILA